MNPHTASKWMMDRAFAEDHLCQGVLYVEDDAILSPDAFMLVDYVLQRGRSAYPLIGGAYDHRGTKLLGCCLYHETIPEVYIPNPPDPRKLHASNGVNTHGGTLFLRKPYMEILSPNWNCKQVEPKGFDYSAHLLMYLHGLFMIYPDLSRSMNIGWSGGSLSQPQWAKYCGRSIWVHADNAVRSPAEFEWDGVRPERFLEEWMLPELKQREVVEGR